MKTALLSAIILTITTSPILSASEVRQTMVKGLLTEYLVNPLGIDTSQPAFSWQIQSDERGVRQSAYQVQVATSPELLIKNEPDMWDSGKVKSNRSIAVPYSGKELKSRTAYFWRVRIWDGTDVPSLFSDTARFETAFLDQNEWQGKWITTGDGGGGNGYHSQFADTQNTVKWVQIDLGRPRAFTTVVLYPAWPYNWKHDEPGFGFPVRYRIEISDDPAFTEPRVIADRTQDDQPNLGSLPIAVPVGEQTARFIRITATKLHHPRDTKPLLAFAEIEVLNVDKKNISLGCPVTALDSIEDSGWSKDRLTDGGRVSREPGGVSPLMRLEFTLDKPVSKARAYVTGLGYYELRINGEKAGDRVLDPPYTNFDKRVYYSTYDVTKMLKQGKNCAGAVIGQGWWRKGPQFLLQIDVTFTDGTRTSVVSNDSWKWTSGPIVENSLYNGETYDAQKELPGWDKPEFDDSAWQAVQELEKPYVQLSAQMIQPIKVVETLKPKSVNSPRPGVYVYDFGQNFSGWCRLKVTGPRGTKVQMRHAELLYPDGTINAENLRSAKATDTYILRGAGLEVYDPRFTYHGFRYVQLEGFPGTPTLDTIEGQVVHTALEPRGTFECSNEMLNQIQKACQWGERTNFHSIPTDCPQRDERQGWMGDAHMSAGAMLLNFNMPPAYTKFLQDIKDAQGEDGRIPDTVPHVWGSNPGDPMWSIAYPLILWDTVTHTGDQRLLKEHYSGVKRYVEMLQREAKDYVIERNNYGDWIGVVETPRPLISTGSFLLAAKVAADMADMLGQKDNAAHFRDLSKKIAEAFNKQFFDIKTFNYGNKSQFSNAFPLYLDIVPPEHKQAVLDNLIEDIMENHKGHLSTGFIGTPYLMDVLMREGKADIAYIIATREDYPGWGYMIKNGATTIWELWRLETGPGMNSHNHPALGFISEWYYSVLAGINPDPTAPGWERFIVKPYILGDLKWARGKVETLRGTVESKWERTSSGVKLSVTVPANTRAAIYVPKLGSKQCKIRESGTVVNGKDAGDWVMFEVGSGKYHYETEALTPR